MNKQLAVVFPGQGSQSLGMLKELATEYPIVLQTFTEASQVLGYDLWQLVQEGPEQKLNQTEYTQPALLAASVAIWRVRCADNDIQPAMMAGHSLGEYSALVCAQAMTFTDAIALVALRGRLMSQAVPNGTGSMAAILGLEDSTVESICQQASGEYKVSAANYNSPGQVVIAGHTQAVQKAIELAKEAGAKRAIELAVSVPSHCELMLPASEELSLCLADINISEPKFQILNNVTAKAVIEPEKIREMLVKQLYYPVQWVAIIKEMGNAGITQIAECGPGRVLTGLNKRINRAFNCFSVYDSELIYEGD